MIDLIIAFTLGCWVGGLITVCVLAMLEVQGDPK